MHQDVAIRIVLDILCIVFYWKNVTIEINVKLTIAFQETFHLKKQNKMPFHFDAVCST